MSPRSLLEAAYAADPIACWVALAAVLVVGTAALVRKGFIDARFIIDVFSVFATIGTVLKIGLWMARTLAGEVGAVAPGGTDLLLVAGGLFAIGFVTLQGLSASFPGSEKERSLLENGYMRVPAFVRSRLVWIGRQPGADDREIAGETEDAMRERVASETDLSRDQGRRQGQ